MSDNPDQKPGLSVSLLNVLEWLATQGFHDSFNCTHALDLAAFIFAYFLILFVCFFCTALVEEAQTRVPALWQTESTKVQFRLSLQLNILLSAVEKENPIDWEIVDNFCASVPGKMKQDPKYYEILQTLSWQVRLIIISPRLGFLDAGFLNGRFVDSAF